MSDAEIALFPLQSVLFPGGPLPLRIFEPRYVDMVSRCMKTNAGFGVLAINSGSEVGEAETFSVGTLAEIVSWYRDEHGLLGITATGRGRFTLESRTRQRDGLYVGQVTWLPAEARTAMPNRYGACAEFLRAVLPQLRSRYGEMEPNLGDASWVGYRLAEILPLDLPAKQALLELKDPVARLAELEPMLERFRMGGRSK
jgi:Lon protease-like protein